MVLSTQLQNTLFGYINSSQESTAAHSKLLEKCQKLYREVCL